MLQSNVFCACKRCNQLLLVELTRRFEVMKDANVISFLSLRHSRPGAKIDLAEAVQQVSVGPVIGLAPYFPLSTLSTGHFLSSLAGLW